MPSGGSKVTVIGGPKVAVKVGQKLPSKNSTIKNSRRREFLASRSVIESRLGLKQKNLLPRSAG